MMKEQAPKAHREMASDFATRAAARRARIVSHRSRSFQEAEQWDLAFWQAQGAAARLSALVALREDLRKIEQARRNG